MNTPIAIIGGGNLGTAIAQGLLLSGFVAPEQLMVTRRNTNQLRHLSEKGVRISSDNQQALQFASWIILAVKPFQVQELLQQLQPHLEAGKHKLISVITGVWLKDLENMTGGGFTLFRAMPNTAIALRESMTCVCSNYSSEADNRFVMGLFNQLGRTVFINEDLMDAATVLGACGTAYAMRYIRANIQGGIEIGFSAEIASLIAAQTVKGATELLLTQNTHPEQEIDKVTTPKGCTIAGLNEMEHQGFSSSLIKGLITSYKKIKADL